MLQAGHEVLLEDGFGLATDDLTYKRVFEHLELTRGVKVTRGSIHERIWASQRDFQLDVLKRAARRDSTHSLERTTEAVGGILAKADLGTPESRAAALKEAVRIGARVNLEAAESDELWALWESVSAVVAVQTTGIEMLDDVRAELSASYAESTDALVDFYNAMIDALGLRVRPGLGLTRQDAVRKYAMVVTALSEGSSLRRRHATDYAELFELPTGRDREPESWDLFALGFWALTQFFFEDAAAGSVERDHRG